MAMLKFILIILISLSFSVHSSETKISLVLPLVDGWAHKTNKSYAPEAINRITKGDLRKKISLNYRPFKRALQAFKKKKFDCFVGGDENTMLDFASVKTISSKMIRNTSLRVYTLKKNKKVMNLKQLEGKKVIYVRGLELKSLEHDFSKVQTSSVNDVIQAVKMMKAERIEALLHWFPSTKEIMSDFHNHHSIILYTIKERVNCHINARSKKFIKELNEMITSFDAVGGIKKLHTDFYGDLPFKH